MLTELGIGKSPSYALTHLTVLTALLGQYDYWIFFIDRKIEMKISKIICLVSDHSQKNSTKILRSLDCYNKIFHK